MAGAFQGGFRMGQQAWQQALDNERRAKLDARQEVLNQRADKEYERQQGLQRDEDVAWGNLSGLQTMGVITPGQVYQPPQIAADGRRTGLPEYELATESTVRPANDIELERAYGGLAAARRNIGEMRTSQQALRVLQRDKETRDFVAQTKKLYDQRAASPESMQAWMAHVQPYTGMISKYAGLDLDARVNPKTGALEMIPYTGAKPGEPPRAAEVSFEEALPYLLQTQRLASQYGSPDAAVEALNKMTAEQRARIMGDTNFRFGLASKLDESAHRARTAAETTRHNQATEKNQGALVQLQRDRLTREPRATRELDPADVKRLNDMAVAIQAEADPVKRQKLMQDYRVAQAGAMSKIGRVVGLPEPKVALDIPYDKFMEIYGDQKVEKVKGEMVKLRDLPPEKGRAYYMQFRNGADGLGGLPDVAPPPRNPTAASTPSAPPAGNYGLFEAMPDSELARYVRAGNALAVEVARRRRSEPVPVTNETPY